jgi:hypothetical protein
LFYKELKHLLSEKKEKVTINLGAYFFPLIPLKFFHSCVGETLMTANGAWNNPHTSSRIMVPAISMRNEAKTWGMQLFDTSANVWSDGSSLVPVVCPFDITWNRGTKCREKPTRSFLRVNPKELRKTENSGMLNATKGNSIFYLKTH